MNQNYRARRDAEDASIIARHPRIVRTLRRADTGLELREDPTSRVGSYIVTSGEQVIVGPGIDAVSYFEQREAAS